jgi:CofD-related protein of GAK system
LESFPRPEDMRSIAGVLSAAGLSLEDMEEGGGGPVLFFSGGSAIKDIVRALADLTPSSIHVLTTFDSGGSSAELRRTFKLPGIGDLRLRLVSLADYSDPAVARACRLFEQRFPARGERDFLLAEWEKLLSGTHPWLEGLSAEFTEMTLSALSGLNRIMPADFDLRGAALGNLILAADYLAGESRSLRATLERFSVRFKARGLILPVCEEAANLAVILDSGRIISGQHRFTGKGEVRGRAETGRNGRSSGQRQGRLRERIRKLFYCFGALPEDRPGEEETLPIRLECSPELPGLLRKAAVICYPPGSFYSSVLANIQLAGVGRAVTASPGHKIYIPNPGPDPETLGLTLRDEVEEVLRALLEDAPGRRPDEALNYLLIDGSAGIYNGGVPVEWCRKRGIEIIDYNFTRPAGPGENFPPADPVRSSLFLYLLARSRKFPAAGGQSQPSGGCLKR